MEFEMGISYNQAEEENTFTILPEAVHEVMVKDIKLTHASSGRPMLEWLFEVINNPEFKSRKIYERTVLPWHDGTEFITSGLFRITNLTAALGMPWEGEKLYTEDYMGKTCAIKVIHKPYAGKNLEYYDENGIGNPMPEIKSFIK